MDWTATARGMFAEAAAEGSTAKATVTVFVNNPPADATKGWEYTSVAAEVIIDVVSMQDKRHADDLSVGQLMDSDNIPKEERRLMLLAADLPGRLNVGSTMQCFGGTWVIASVDPLSVGGVDIVYILQVRR